MNITLNIYEFLNLIDTLNILIGERKMGKDTQKYIWFGAFAITTFFLFYFMVMNSGAIVLTVDMSLIFIIILLFFSLVTLGMLIQNTLKK